jgi:two-component system, OmpR family, response regulator ResD
MPTILVIDDSPIIYQLMRRTTRAAHGWQFLLAADGSTGLQMLREHLHQIDAILLDVIMPDMDGWWVCARIRQLCPTLPIIPFTAEPDSVPMLVEEFGCAPPLIKPVSIERILAALQTQSRTKDGISQRNPLRCGRSSRVRQLRSSEEHAAPSEVQRCPILEWLLSASPPWARDSKT